MQKIDSFKVNHLVLLPGLYVSRKDKVGNEIITTFDMRVTRPNLEPVMDTGSMHTIEHLAATFLRNEEEWKSKTIYFGPMGCRTGFYIIFSGDLDPHEIIPLIKKMVSFIISYEGLIPGATMMDCGNYSDMNLNGAKLFMKKYQDEVLTSLEERRFYYEQ